MAKTSNTMKAVRLSVLSTAAALSILLSISRPGSTAPAGGTGGRNLLLITIDTLRADRLGCYGSERSLTPRIDALAEGSLLFTRAFAHNSVTLPSHANILLGTTPLVHGVHDGSMFVVGDEHLTLSEHLKAQGYATGAFVGAFPLDSRFGLNQGFDVYDDDFRSSNTEAFEARERKAEEVTQRALRWLREQTSPWFLWVHVYDPHDPYESPEPYRTRFSGEPYDGEVAYVDAVLGKFLDDAARLRAADDTVVILTSDHGESLGQHGEETHGYFAYNTTIWAPLIVKVPAVRPNRIDVPVAHIDIFPTACHALGVKPPPSLQGLSLLSKLNSRKVRQRLIYFESLYPYYSRGWAPQIGFIRQGMKFIDSPIPELYDLEKDFDELHNLTSSAPLEGYLNEMADLIKDLSPRDGPMPAPDTKVNRKKLEALRSLGYISSPGAAAKRSFGPEDDVKTLLPFHNRTLEATRLYARDKAAGAVDRLKNIIAERSDLDIAYTALAIILRDQGRLIEGLETLKQGISVLPSNYEILSKSLNFLVEAKRYPEVIELIEGCSLPTILNDPDTWNLMGISLHRTARFERAGEAFKRALSLDGNHAVAHKNLGTLHFEMFLAEKQARDYETSLEHFKKALEIDPEYASAYNGLGAAYLQAGHLDGAIHCLKRAIELDPDYGAAMYNLGLAYFNAGRKAEAYAYLTQFQAKYADGLAPAQRRALESLISKCKQ